MPFLGNTFKSKNFKRTYPEDILDINKYNAQNKCPANDHLCNEEAVWLVQSMLLGTKSDMDDIAIAIEKVHNNADKIKSKK